MAEIRNGEVYEVNEIKKPYPAEMGEVFAVTDRSGESYIYPKKLFQMIED